MSDFQKLLDTLNLQEETQALQIPMAPQATMSDALAEAAQAEAQEMEPARAPASPLPTPKLDATLAEKPALPVVETRNKTSISETIPQSQKADGDETAEAKLERLMRDLNEQRKKETEEAASRKFKADIFKILADNAGGIIGGAQAMNTGASVTPAKTQGYDVGDLVGQVDKRFAGDRQALLDQYQQLLNARDRSEQRKFQQESLQIQREGNQIKKLLADQKNNKLSNTLTPGEKKVDETFAKDYNNLTSKGFNNAETSIAALNSIADELEKEGDGLLSAGGGRTSILPDAVRQSDSIRWRDTAANQANATLKELFPGSLSDDERRAAAREFYNDKLSNKENAKIIRDKASQLSRSLADQRAKADYFSREGTLKGMGPSAPAMQSSTVRIQGPSGQIAEVSAEKAEKYLSKPGYKRVD